MIRGIDVILHRKQQTGEDAFGAPVFNEVSETVHNVTVEFFGQRFRTYGDVTEGIEAMIPLRWNRKVKVEQYG